MPVEMPPINLGPEKVEPKKPKLPKIVKSIMREFDFYRVHKVMSAMDWKWVDDTGPADMSIPTTDRLKKCAQDLLLRAYNEKSKKWSIGTGGFMAKKNKHGLSLTFEVESWDEEFNHYD